MQVTGRTLITGSADGTVRFWDIETAQSLNVLDLVRLPRKGAEPRCLQQRRSL